MKRFAYAALAVAADRLSRMLRHLPDGVRDRLARRGAAFHVVGIEQGCSEPMMNWKRRTSSGSGASRVMANEFAQSSAPFCSLGGLLPRGARFRAPTRWRYAQFGLLVLVRFVF